MVSDRILIEIDKDNIDNYAGLHPDPKEIHIKKSVRGEALKQLKDHILELFPNSTVFGHNYTSMADLDGILDECNKLEHKMIAAFSSIKCRVDPALKGNEHYLVVSSEMFEKIKKERNRDSRPLDNLLRPTE